MTTQQFHIDALDYFMDDCHPRRCWIQNKDLRKVRLAIHERESRTWLESAIHGVVSVLGVFLQ